MRTILLTGVTGFLGSALLRRLLDSNYFLIALIRNQSSLSRLNTIFSSSHPNVLFYNIDTVPLETIFESHQIDSIIHCATDYGRKDTPRTQLIQANLTLPLKLLDLAKKHGTALFINTDTILDKRVNEYSLSKKQFLDWLHVFSADLACINIALEHFYGFNDDTTKFLTYVIHSFLNNQNLKLTPGEQKRDFIYIDDVISAFEYIIKASEGTAAGFWEYEVGSGQSISIKELVKDIQLMIPESTSQVLFGAIPYRKNEIMNSNVNLNAIKSLGWIPKVSLQEGLKKTIEWEKEKIKGEN